MNHLDEMNLDASFQPQQAGWMLINEDSCDILPKHLGMYTTEVILLSRVPASMLQVMAKYNALSQHLLRLKRVNAELDAAWASLRRQAGAESLQSRQPVWDVRLHMAHLLLNLQVYMQVRSLGFLLQMDLGSHSIQLSVGLVAQLSTAGMDLVP